MIHLTEITGLASSTVAITGMAALMLRAAPIRKSRFALLLCAVAIVVLIPLGDLTLAAYVRSVIGDLSITSLVLLTLAILEPLLGWPSSQDKAKTQLHILVGIAALGLYPMALSIGLFDPYRLGYANPWFMGGLMLLAMAAYFRQLPVVALTMALAVLAWIVGWYESNNLWDYLIDPLLAIYAISALVRHGIQMILKVLRG